MVLLALSLLAMSALGQNPPNPWAAGWAKAYRDAGDRWAQYGERNWGWGGGTGKEPTKKSNALEPDSSETSETSDNNKAEIRMAGRLRGSRNDTQMPAPGSIGSPDDPSFQGFGEISDKLKTVNKDFVKNCRHRRGCNSTQRILVKIQGKMQDCIDEYHHRGQIIQNYETASVLTGIPDFHDRLHTGVIHRVGFRKVWDRQTKGSGAIYANALTEPPWNLSDQEANFVVTVADDDNSGDVNRWELVDYIHAASVLTRVVGKHSYDVSSVNCWAGVFHDENRRMNSFLCP